MEACFKVSSKRERKKPAAGYVGYLVARAGEHFIMGDIGIEFQKEFLVFWVVHSFLKIRTGEGFNGFPRLPQSEQRKLGFSLFDLPQHENALVAGDRGVLFESGF